MYSPCITVEDGYQTCDEVCAGHGEACVGPDEYLHCSVVAPAWGWFFEDSCKEHIDEDGGGFSSLLCSDPIPFGNPICDPGNCTYFACCCTQTAKKP